MKHLILSFIVSFLVNIIVIKLSKKINKLITDYVHLGPQTFHDKPTPRLGGISLFIAFFITNIYTFIFKIGVEYVLLILTISSMIIFLAGLYEDITNSLSPKIRMLLIFIGASLAYFLLGAKIVRLDIPYIDSFVSLPLVSFLFTTFAIVGLTNAINIIDGFNGLASGVSVMIFMAIAAVAFYTGDKFILFASITMIGAILGFFIFNYPYGLIFLGDGGAYFIGFVIAVLSILLVKNHTQVSAWFAIVVSIYPIFETVFSMFRRRFYKKSKVDQADSFHLHQLIYKRVIPQIFNNIKDEKLARNSATSIFLWLLCSLGTIPAIIFWNNTIALIVSSIMFCAIYAWFYRRIVKFKLIAKKS